jgi:hypothetical protein
MYCEYVLLPRLGWCFAVGLVFWILIQSYSNGGTVMALSCRHFFHQEANRWFLAFRKEKGFRAAKEKPDHHPITRFFKQTQEQLLMQQQRDEERARWYQMRRSAMDQRAIAKTSSKLNYVMQDVLAVDFMLERQRQTLSHDELVRKSRVCLVL